MYSIAWRFGVDYRSLAAWNGIDDSYRIFPGQELRFSAQKVVVSRNKRSVPRSQVAKIPVAKSGKKEKNEKNKEIQNIPTATAKTVDTSSTKVAANRPRVSTGPAKPRKPPVKPVVRTESTPKKGVSSKPVFTGKLTWQWPASGEILARFSKQGLRNNGLDLVGNYGDPVLAASAGRVVFAGIGPRGYGNMVIIDHDQKYMSAYAHNRKVLVKEGQVVTTGQKIAEFGKTDATRVMLHFEIRKGGVPVDPLKYLPKR